MEPAAIPPCQAKVESVNATAELRAPIEAAAKKGCLTPLTTMGDRAVNLPCLATCINEINSSSDAVLEATKADNPGGIINALSSGRPGIALIISSLITRLVVVQFCPVRCQKGCGQSLQWAGVVLVVVGVGAGGGGGGPGGSGGAGGSCETSGGGCSVVGGCLGGSADLLTSVGS